MAKRKKLKKGTKRGVIVSLMVVILLIGGFFLYQTLKTNSGLGSIFNIPEAPTLQILDLDNTDRPFAVIINNHGSARPFHSGLQDAFIIYEMVVEGGMTRYLALFDGRTDTNRIGSVRSARHYFLDYVLEHDAILIHNGQSPQARDDFRSLGIDRIEVSSNRGGFRDNDLRIAVEHRLFTRMELLHNARGNIRNTRNRDYLLNYSIELIDLSEKEGVRPATEVEIRYPTLTITFRFDEETNRYLRYVNNVAHIDFPTGNQLNFKNIITYQVANFTIDRGRQGLRNIGSGNGYFITGGYAVPITWEKSSRSAQTIYRFADGTPLVVNDGNTFIQIQPTNQRLSID